MWKCVFRCNAVQTCSLCKIQLEKCFVIGLLCIPAALINSHDATGARSITQKRAWLHWKLPRPHAVLLRLRLYKHVEFWFSHLHDFSNSSTGCYFLFSLLLFSLISSTLAWKPLKASTYTVFNIYIQTLCGSTSFETWLKGCSRTREGSITFWSM